MLDDKDRIYKNLYGQHEWGLQGARRLGAWDVQRDRVGAAGQREMPVGVAAPALGDDFLAGKVDVVDGDAADQLDVVADEPAEPGPFQRAVCGQNPHRNVGVLAAERLGSAQPRRTAADGDETWCHHTSWAPLRRVDRTPRKRFVTFAEPVPDVVR